MPTSPQQGTNQLNRLGPLFQMVNLIKNEIGAPYVYGTEGPSTFDCSGLVQWAAGKAGIKGVPRTSEAQWAWVDKIPLSQLQPGDLVFSQWPGDNASPGHVQVYVGGGQVIGADNTHTGVEQTSLAASAGHVVGYGRIPGQPAGSGGSESLLNTLTGGLSGYLSSGGSLLSLAVPQPVLDTFTGLQKVAEGLAWFVNPENWARVLSGGLGVILLIFGMVFLIRAGM